MFKFTYRHYIAITCEDQLREYTPEQKEIILDYCEEYITQYRQENPVKNLPHLKYFVLMAVGRLDKRPACGIPPPQTTVCSAMICHDLPEARGFKGPKVS